MAELVPARPGGGFPFGIAREEPLAAPGDGWRQPMSDEEAARNWIEGRVKIFTYTRASLRARSDPAALGAGALAAFASSPFTANVALGGWW